MFCNCGKANHFVSRMCRSNKTHYTQQGQPQHTSINHEFIKSQQNQSHPRYLQIPADIYTCRYLQIPADTCRYVPPDTCRCMQIPADACRYTSRYLQIPGARCLQIPPDIYSYIQIHSDTCITIILPILLSMSKYNVELE